jgi:WD40 repeat protein
MRCDTPKKQFGSKKTSGAIIYMHAIADSIFVIHSDFTLCTYKLQPIRGEAPFYFRIDKARALECKDVVLSKPIEIDESYNYVDDRQPQRNASFAIAFGANFRAPSSGGSSSDPTHVLFSCGYFDNSVKIHSLDSFQLQSNINGVHRGRINCLEVDDEGAIMVTGGDDATGHIWIVDHNALASAITDGFVKSSLGRDRSEETRCYHAHTLLGHVTPICCIAMCTKLDVVLTGSLDGSICIHNIRSGKFNRALHVDAVTGKVQESCAGNGIPVRKLAIYNDGFFVAHLCDGSLHVISINGQQLCSTNAGEIINTMIICPKSEAVITGGDKGCVRIWALPDLTLRCTVDVKKNGAITGIALTPGAQQFLCIGSGNGMLSIVSRMPW